DVAAAAGAEWVMTTNSPSIASSVASRLGWSSPYPWKSGVDLGADEAVPPQRGDVSSGLSSACTEPKPMDRARSREAANQIGTFLRGGRRLDALRRRRRRDPRHLRAAAGAHAVPRLPERDQRWSEPRPRLPRLPDGARCDPDPPAAGGARAQAAGDAGLRRGD